MNKQIITGVVCGGIGIIIGCKLVSYKVKKILNSDELKEKLSKEVDNMFKEYQESKTIYKDVVFNTMSDGIEVLDALKDVVQKYGVASVADMYDISGLTSKLTDNKYGWDDISSAEVVFDNNLYVLKMPKTIKLK